MTPAPRAEAVAHIREPTLEDRLVHKTDSRLHDAILDRRNAQRPCPAIAFWNVHPFDGLRMIRTFPQRRRQLGQIKVCPRRELADRLPIHARSTFVRPDLRPRERQRLGREHLVHQAEPLAAFDPVDQGRQHPLRPHRSFGPHDHGSGLCIARSRLRHSRCFLCSRHGRRVSTFLPTLPRPGFASRAFRDRFGRDRSGTMRALTPAGLAHTRQVSPLPLRGRPSIQPPPTSCASMSLWQSHQRIEIGLATQASPGSGKLATSTPPKRVRHPAGYSFASGCSPPRLTATQLPSAT